MGSNPSPAVVSEIPTRFLPGDRRYQPLVVVALALAAGIAIDRYLPQWGTPTGNSRWMACWLTSGGLWWLWLILWRRGQLRASSYLLLAAVAVTGATWHHQCWRLFSVHEVARYARGQYEPAVALATALDRPTLFPAPRPNPFWAIPRGPRSRMTIRLRAIRDGHQWRPAAGIANLSIDGHRTGIRAGDQIQIFGHLRSLLPAQNPGEFDFARRSRRDRKLVTLSSHGPECVHLVSRGPRWSLSNALASVRARLERAIDHHVGPERADLAAAMLLGRREKLSATLTSRYMVTGTIHLLVVSGLHVAIVAAGLFIAKRCGLLPRRTALTAIMLLVFGYMLLVGARPPVIRATILIVLLCVAAWKGRSAVAFNSLAAAAIVVLVLNPVDLFQAGPQLSFLAVATLIAVGQWQQRWQQSVRRDPLQQLLASARPWYAKMLGHSLRCNGWLLLATSIVWLTALPLVMHRFHLIAPAAVVISPLLWPVVTVALLSGVVMLATEWILPPVAGLSGWVCDGSLRMLEGIIAAAEEMPAGHFWIGGPPTWWVVGFYAGLMWWFLAANGKRHVQWLAASFCLWTILGVSIPAATNWLPRDNLRCGFLSLGHGGCAILRAPTGETLLYDAGSLCAPRYAAETVASYLWQQGVHHIDAIVLSHADVDHFNALPELLKRFSVAKVLVSPRMFADQRQLARNADQPPGAPEVLRQMLDRYQIRILQLARGDRIRLGEHVNLDVLHPPRHIEFGSDNANSVTLGAQFGDLRLLLPGDLEGAGLNAVLNQDAWDCDILLAPHHGSVRSNPPRFAQWSTPEWVIISGGNDARTADVVETYQNCGARVFRTERTGAVEFLLSQQRGVLVSTWRE